MSPTAWTWRNTVLHYYNDYSAIPVLRFKKLDLDCAARLPRPAPENSEPFTYRETDLLIDLQKRPPTEAKKNVVSIICARDAHQWFRRPGHMPVVGQYLAQRGLRDMDGEQAPRRLAPGVERRPERCRRRRQHPSTLTHSPPPAPSAPRQNAGRNSTRCCDGIAYEKPGDVLLMVENYVGPETFRQGVHAYLSAHTFNSNATAEDFCGRRPR